MYLWGVSGSAVASLASVVRKRFGKPTARRVVELSWRQELDVTGASVSAPPVASFSVGGGVRKNA